MSIRDMSIRAQMAPATPRVMPATDGAGTPQGAIVARRRCWDAFEGQKTRKGAGGVSPWSDAPVSLTPDKPVPADGLPVPERD